MSAAVASIPAFHERLQANYSIHLKREIDLVTAIRPIHALSSPDISPTRQEAAPVSSWVPAHNPFAFYNTPVLPRWEQILKKFLDNEFTPISTKVVVFAAMAKAYNDSVYRPKALDSTQSDAFHEAYGDSLRPFAPVPAFVNYALSVLTRSLNEKECDDKSSTTSSTTSSSSSSTPSGLSQQELERLRRFGLIWFYALLEGSVDCVLVGYHNVDPWHLWMGFVEHLPIPELWRAMVLQYISYEHRFGFLYSNFFCTDMYEQLAHHHSDTKADPLSAVFVHTTTNFKEIYQELKCAPSYSNPLFVGLM